MEDPVGTIWVGAWKDQLEPFCVGMGDPVVAICCGYGRPSGSHFVWVWGDPVVAIVPGQGEVRRVTVPVGVASGRTVAIAVGGAGSMGWCCSC